jgi:hypothetical protein
MPGSPAQQSRTREYFSSVVGPAEAALRVANSRPLKLYALVNGLEAQFWAAIGTAIGYFDFDGDPFGEVGEKLETLSEMVLRDVGGESAFADVMERLWPTPQRDVPVEEIRPNADLHARFQTMLMLETDLIRGTAMTLLSSLAFADPPEWDALVFQGHADADDVAAALGGEVPNPTSLAYADYFAALDHIAAFDVLDAREGEDDDVRRLKAAVGGMVRWRLNLWDRRTEARFRRLTREVTGILLDEFAKSGAGPRLAHGMVSDRIDSLTENWKRLTAYPGDI